MRSSSRKAVVLAFAGALAVLGWMALQPQPAHAAQFCANYQNKFCFNEGQQFLCTYFGCPRWLVFDGWCSCEGGRWNCTPDGECGGDSAAFGDDEADPAAEAPEITSAEPWTAVGCE